MADKQLGMELHPVYDKYDFPVTDPEKREGFAGFLTPEQQNKVKELRKILKSWRRVLDNLDPEQKAQFEIDHPGEFDGMLESISEYVYQ